MAADIGKVFENEIQKVFKQLKTSHLVGCQRFSDSGAAGSVVAEQPADYLVGFPPGSQLRADQLLAFVEVKASEVHHTLGKAMVRPGQRGAISWYRYLLGIPYYILFWDTQHGVIQLWDGIAIHGDGRISKDHILAEWEGCGTVNRLRHEVVADHLVRHFQIPPAAVTLQKVR
jgi:hypothetical protein